MTRRRHIWSRQLLAAFLLAAIAMTASGGSEAEGDPVKGGFLATTVEGPTLPVTTAGHAGGIVDGAQVVAGGSSWSADKTTKRWLTECFVFRDEAWKAGPSLPHPLSDPAYASDETGLYVAGGTDGKNETDHVLHLAGTANANQWEPMPALPAPVEGANGAIISHTFYVFGGFSEGKPSNALWSLDLRSKSAKWKPVAPLPADGRAYCALVAQGSQLCLFGGFASPPYTKSVTIFADAYRYDPSSDRWTRLEIGNFPGYGWTAAAVGKNEIMLAGRVAELGKISDDICLLDISSGTTRTIGKLKLGACCAPLLQVDKQTWWFIGGEPDTNRSRSDRTSIIRLETLPHP